MNEMDSFQSQQEDPVIKFMSVSLVRIPQKYEKA